MKKEFGKILFIILVMIFFVLVLFTQKMFFGLQMNLIDKLFVKKIPNQDIVIVEIDSESINKIGRWPWDRKIHAELIEKICLQNPAVLGIDVSFSEESSSSSDSLLAESLTNCPQVVLPLMADVSFNKNGIIANSLIYPIPKLREHSRLGIVNSPLDRDEVFRRSLIDIYDKDGNIYNSFASAVAFDYLGKDDFTDIALDKQGRMIVNYTGPPGNFKSISVYDFMMNETDVSLQNKIVLVGATASDLHDEQIVPTSIGLSMSGVEIHANIINTIIEGNFLVNVSDYVQMIIFIVLILLVSLFLFKFKLIKGTIFTILLLVFYFILALVIFDFGYILDLFYSIFSIGLAYLVIVVYKNLTDRKEKKKIKNTFSRYVSSDIIDEILKNPEKLKLGGEKKNLSILFSDIRDFTSISEKLSPEDLVSLLNEYLTVMTDLIMDFNGVVDKYIGDAIMAFWGAPIFSDKHARHSCEVAMLMIKRLEEKQCEWHEKYGVNVDIGIGINTGDVIIGNMGSDKRFDYTVMGDTVNISSRLEGATKNYGVKIIVGSATKESAGDSFVFRYLDKVAVKGKKESVDMFELVGFGDDVGEDEKEFIKKFEKAVRFYQNRQWKEAVLIFKELKKIKRDKILDLYIERCENLINNPPNEDWDGICRFTSK